MAASRYSSSVLGWSDLELVIRAVEEFHNVFVSLEITVAGLGLTSGIRATATARRKDRAAVGASPSVSRSLMIGSNDPGTGVAAMFRLIHTLDRDCGELWAQAELFKSV